ncbi:MAG: hypothetical protein KGJ89_00325 [Patescibacteria group bacterium]|nr:hypothetical protein [Patescibacteria group bacterium]MDE2014966.1 hypothetical protein [Patescibacteria group bacterium]MDE2226395.1 hypothetical protein [Patescibacteria group bacterium]
MSNAEINISELRDRKRRQRLYIFVGIIILIVYLILLGASWLVFRSPVFRIKEINIIGNKSVASSTIMDLLDSRLIAGNFSHAILGFNNILIWPELPSDKDLALVPEIKSLKIEKDFQDRTVSVMVEERQPYGIWCLRGSQTDVGGMQADAKGDQGMSAASTGDSCWWFDNEGTVFQRAVPAQGSLIMVVDDYYQKNLGLGRTVLPSKFMDKLNSIFKVLRNSGVSVKEIRLNDLSLEELEVDTHDGPTLYFSLRFPADNDLSVLNNFMSKPGFSNWQYFDFRVENRAYYK